MTSGMEIFKGLKDEVKPELVEEKFLYLEACINAGVNFIVTAEMYGGGVSELILGENLKIGKWDVMNSSFPKNFSLVQGGFEAILVNVCELV